MKNGQLKPGYNIQVGSCNGFVVNWSTHQNRNDNGTLIPHLERYQRFFRKLPDSIGADSGYGNQENYEHLKENHIKNYIKYRLFHKEQTKNSKIWNITGKIWNMMKLMIDSHVHKEKS